MNAKLFEIVLERLTDSSLASEESNLVLAACQGEEALQRWLQDGQGPSLESGAGGLESGAGVYLNSISVQGFRGIGQNLDETENVALGVMSQGELNALALSLFLPRATQPESPFRFLCIDDPVQAMDPAKVDGLARALEQVAQTHQVLVFTHDSRLFEAVLRLGIRAQVLEVTRRARSSVELRSAHDPIEQALADARALALTRELPERVGRKVVPNFCRRALEICLTEIYRRKHPVRSCQGSADDPV